MCGHRSHIWEYRNIYREKYHITFCYLWGKIKIMANKLCRQNDSTSCCSWMFSLLIHFLMWCPQWPELGGQSFAFLESCILDIDNNRVQRYNNDSQTSDNWNCQTLNLLYFFTFVDSSYIQAILILNLQESLTFTLFYHYFNAF